MNGFLPIWPAAASDHATKVDWLFAGFAVLVLLLTAPVFLLTIWFAIRYRRGREANRSPRASGNTALELAWTIIPFLLILGFFGYAAVLYLDLGHAPADSLVIDAVGKQWMWKFEHPGGQREINDLHVPMGQNVKLVMTSQDVIHSLFLPALRIKQDVLPGRYTSLWFNADRAGVYDLRCSQFCGLDHSRMVGRLYVLTPGQYAAWLEQAGTDGDLAQQGAVLFRGLGCSGCHEPQSTVRAPSLTGLYGRPVPLQDGRVAVADDGYLRDSILYPNRDVAAGYPAMMPTFAGQVDEDEVMRLVAYIKSQASPPPPEPTEARR